MLLKPQPPPNTMLKPCHVWFLLPWAEMHVNTFYDLAGCQGMVFRICSPDGLEFCLNWWSSWRKASKPFGSVTRTVSRLGRPPPLLFLSPASSLLSLTHAQTHSLSTEIPLSGICGHSLCALMGKRRHPISPLAGPASCGLMKKLLSKAIRALIASGPIVASPWPSEGLWSVGKQHEDSLHPGTSSLTLLQLPLVWPKHPSSPASAAGHCQSLHSRKLIARRGVTFNRQGAKEKQVVLSVAWD